MTRSGTPQNINAPPIVDSAIQESQSLRETLHSLRRNPKVLPLRIASVHHPLRFQEQHPNLLVRFWALQVLQSVIFFSNQELSHHTVANVLQHVFLRLRSGYGVIKLRAGKVTYMLYTFRDHKYLPGLQDDISVPQLNIQRAV